MEGLSIFGYIVGYTGLVGIVLYFLYGIYRCVLMYTVSFHRWRKYKYRIVQSTVMQHYNAEPVVKYIIQRKSIFGWRDNPDVPSYDRYGDMSIYHTHHFDSLEECQEWMDGIEAVSSDNPARKDNVV